MPEDVRIFEAQATRVETGPIQFGDDWPGVFIRGDNALAAAYAIEQAIAILGGRAGPHLLVAAQLEGLMEDLRACRVGAASEP